MNGLTGDHIMKRPNQPRPTAAYMTANAGTPRWTCQYTTGYPTGFNIYTDLQKSSNTAVWRTEYYGFLNVYEMQSYLSCLINHMHFLHGHLVADVLVFCSIVGRQGDVDEIYFSRPVFLQKLEEPDFRHTHRTESIVQHLRERERETGGY